MQGIPHHMLDVAQAWDDFSVSRYCNQAAPIVDDIIAQGKTAIIAGGTGLYMDSLIRGNNFAPFPSTGVREALEARAEAEGIQPLLEELAQVDPESAGRLHPSDRKRIIRALEVYRETGITITEHNRRTREVPPKYRPVWLGLDFSDRAALYRRIDRRVERMLEAGLLDEIRSLLESGIPETCTAMQAIGYKEFLPVLRGERGLCDAAAEVCQSSRRYAKRQLTWFRRNPNMHWIVREEDGAPDEIIRQARQILQEFDN